MLWLCADIHAFLQTSLCDGHARFWLPEKGLTGFGKKPSCELQTILVRSIGPIYT
jgi:hypothetical protein